MTLAMAPVTVDGVPLPEGWAATEQEAVERLNAVYARRDARRQAEREQRRQAVLRARAVGLPDEAIAREWDVPPWKIAQWARGEFTGDNDDAATPVRQLHAAACPDDAPPPIPDDDQDAAGHQLLTDFGRLPPHTSDCDSTLCPTCGCCCHCQPGGCGCTGCTDQDCLCTPETP